MKIKPSSSLSIALEAVSDRWSLTIVRHLAFAPLRFTDLAGVTQAPRDVLVNRLRALETSGIVERQPYGSGKREQYALTAKGLDLAEVVLVLKKWGDRYRPEGTGVVTLEHLPCGGEFVARVHCSNCNQPIAAGEIRERTARGGPDFA